MIGRDAARCPDCGLSYGRHHSGCEIGRMADLLRRAKGYLAAGDRTLASAQLVEDIDYTLRRLGEPRTIAEMDA